MARSISESVDIESARWVSGGRGRVDGSESASPKFADDGSAHSGKVPDDPPATTGWSSDSSEDDSAQPFKTSFGHHAVDDPETNSPSNAKSHASQHPADNLLLTPAQQDDDGSPAATDGAHPGRGQGDRSESASPKFADVGDGHSAHATDEDPSVQSAPANNGHH